MLINMKARIDNMDVDLRTVSASQAAKEMRENKGLLIDVREPAEVSANPVKSAIGEAELTLFLSGKLLVKSKDVELARRLARLHLDEWLAHE